MKNNNDLGIYVHIPFCISKCVYCDFLSAPADDSVKKAYMEALSREIEWMADMESVHTQSKSVKSIFFGGGTPSSVAPEYIADTIKTIRKCFYVSEDVEITVECNPGTIDIHKAKVYKEAGVNRISFGLQSADDAVLKMLGRIHTFEQFKESLSVARSAGFDNINIDVMSALPGQSLSDYRESLIKILESDVPHISSYSLIVEEGTPLSDNLSSYPKLPDEDEERKMYYMTDELLTSYGYKRYEISNYSKGKKSVCRHNMFYWDRVSYLGFGIGAASLFLDCRWNNISDLTEYISKAGICDVRCEQEHLSEAEQMSEFMFLGLRKMEGVSMRVFEEQFGRKLSDVYDKAVSDNLKKSLIEMSGDRIKLTKRGIDISNTVMADFII